MKFPEPDFDLDAPDAFAVLAGIFTLHIGAEMSFAREPSILFGVASVYIFGSALLLIGAGITDTEIERWGRPLAALAFLALMTGIGVTFVFIRGVPIQTDALAFINEAAAALLAGQSPYAIDMTMGKAWPTPTLNGGSVSTFSYPLGAALLAAPFRAVLHDGARVPVLLGTAAAGGLLIGYAPGELAPLALLSMLVGDFITWGVADLTDPMWVAPLLGAIVLWPWSNVGRDSLAGSAVLFGVAMAIKQQPWFCAPFLFIWVWRERSLRSAIDYAGIVAATFGLIMLPSLAVAPGATVRGVLTPLYADGGTLVHLGVGLSALTVSGAFPIAKTAHTVVLGLVGVNFLITYWFSFDRVKWLAWVAWAPLLFVNYRSLANYFIVVAPVAVMVLIAKTEVQDATPTLN